MGPQYPSSVMPKVMRKATSWSNVRSIGSTCEQRCRDLIDVVSGMEISSSIRRGIRQEQMALRALSATLAP